MVNNGGYLIQAENTYLMWGMSDDFGIGFLPVKFEINSPVMGVAKTKHGNYVSVFNSEKEGCIVTAPNSEWAVIVKVQE